MCELPLTGSDSAPWLLVGLFALVLGSLLLARTARGRATIVAAVVLLIGLSVSAPQPAYAADCAPPPPATTVLSVSPTVWNAGSAAGSQSFTVTNAGATVAAANLVPAITGSPAFSVSGSTCTGSLAVAASCTVTVTFSPPGSSLAPLTATLAVSADNAATFEVDLEGTDGAIALLAVAPGAVVLNPGDTVFITVTNTSTSSAFDVAASGVVSDVVVDSYNCAPVLHPGSQCQLGLYAPLTASDSAEQMVIAGTNTNTLVVSVTVIVI